MRVLSLRRCGYQLKPLELEVSLIPGLPSIQILGLPDQTIKESALRIRSAFRSLGLPFPKAQTVIVNLKPIHIRKQSRGLEFAIAAALLWEMEVFKKPDHMPVLYGELNLKGGVEFPDDLEDLIDINQNECVWTGVSKENFRFEYPLHQVNDLSQLEQSWVREPDKMLRCLSGEKDFDHFVFGKSDAELIALTAVGEHPLLLAGPAGGGKTTIAKVIHRLLPPIDNKIFKQVRAIHRLDGRTIENRPIIVPHHTASSISIVGGGATAKPGDFTRAHGGVLLLDEYLQFASVVQEALREPMQSGEIRVSRNARSNTYPASALVLATTNLCPCGKWVPQKPTACSHSMRKCQSHLDRLSGPMLDRFSITYFPKSHRTESEGSESVFNIRERVLRARTFSKKRRQEKVNQQLSEAELLKVFPRKVFELLPQLPRRRLLSLLRVARTAADLDGLEVVELRHVRLAKKLSVEPFDQLSRGMF